MMLYKYRSVPVYNAKYFYDIFEQSRLYAARYSELNDPLEGHYSVNKEKIPQSVINEIRHGKHRTRICSLSCKCNSYLMWAHYADGGRGVVIGVNVIGDRQPEPVRYSEQLPAFKPETKAKDILMRKHSLWAYEREYRVLTDREHVKIEVKEVILGSKMAEKDKIRVANFIERVSLEISIKESSPPSQSIFAI